MRWRTLSEMTRLLFIRSCWCWWHLLLVWELLSLAFHSGILWSFDRLDFPYKFVWKNFLFYFKVTADDETDDHHMHWWGSGSACCCWSTLILLLVSQTLNPWWSSWSAPIFSLEGRLNRENIAHFTWKEEGSVPSDFLFIIILMITSQGTREEKEFIDCFVSIFRSLNHSSPSVYSSSWVDRNPFPVNLSDPSPFDSISCTVLFLWWLSVISSLSLYPSCTVLTRRP